MIRGIIDGMALTFRSLFEKRVTIQYPEEKRPVRRVSRDAIP